MKRKIKGFLGSKLSWVILLGLSSMLGGCDLILNPDPPTDTELEKIFRENRSDFEKIVRMSDEDNSVSVIRYKFTVLRGSGDSSAAGEGISEERWLEYKSLFKKIGLETGILRGDDGSVHFSAFSKGIAVSSITKGYIYSADDTPKGDFKCSDDSLDVPAPVYDTPFVCKNLDKNWYLFVSR